MATVECALQPGEVVVVGAPASVQFSGSAGFAFRIVSVDTRPTYEGWAWLDGYQLDEHGGEIRRRKIFVRRAGLRRPH